MIGKDKFEKIKVLLKRDYPVVSTPLKHSNAFELLVAVMLSAQTLDDTVNKITPELFNKYKKMPLYSEPLKIYDEVTKQILQILFLKSITLIVLQVKYYLIF